MKRFSTQIAVIAGGARGIGRGIAERLASEGAKVYVLDVLEAKLKDVVQWGIKKEWEIEGKKLDISSEKQVKESLDEIAKVEGHIDILINSAGIIGSTNTRITEYDSSTFDRVMEINLKGAFLLTKYVIPHMLLQKYGRILHISSIGGKEGNPGMVGYAASKSALMGLVKGVGKEYAESGITVNGIAPAVIATEMNEDTDPKMLKYMVDKIPMKRLGTVDEVASLASWIVSKEASFNTGFIFDLSGGRATF